MTSPNRMAEDSQVNARGWMQKMLTLAGAVLTKHNALWLLVEVTILVGLFVYFRNQRQVRVKTDSLNRVTEISIGTPLTASDLTKGPLHLAEKLSQPSRKTTFNYDAEGNRLTNINPQPEFVTYSYDAEGNQLTNWTSKTEFTNHLGSTNASRILAPNEADK